MTTELILVIFGSTGFWGIIQLLINRKLSKRDEYEQIKDALLAVLHDRLYQGCKYFIHIGSITASALKNLDYLHEAYKKFGGNSIGTELFERCKRLPLKEDDEWMEKL